MTYVTYRFTSVQTSYDEGPKTSARGLQQPKAKTVANFSTVTWDYTSTILKDATQFLQRIELLEVEIRGNEASSRNFMIG